MSSGFTEIPGNIQGALMTPLNDDYADLKFIQKKGNRCNLFLNLCNQRSSATGF